MNWQHPVLILRVGSLIIGVICIIIFAIYTLICEWLSGKNRKCVRDNRKGYHVINYLVRSSHEVARYAKIHI
jgi:hypothetical protein